MGLYLVLLRHCMLSYPTFYPTKQRPPGLTHYDSFSYVSSVPAVDVVLHFSQSLYVMASLFKLTSRAVVRNVRKHAREMYNVKRERVILVLHNLI